MNIVEKLDASRVGGMLRSIPEDGRKAKRILYYGAGWPTNIGNAFIDLGALAVLRAAVGDAHIAFASEMPRWFFSAGMERRSPPGLEKHQTDGGNALDIASVTDCDLMVFSGMAMCEEFIQLNGPSVLELADRGVPVLLMGTGAGNYSKKEKAAFSRFLRRLQPVGFVSRDDTSYEMFSDSVSNAFRGVDSAFYLPESYTPLPLVLSRFVVAAFDSMPEPALDLQGRRLIRSHHECWGPIRTEFSSVPNTLVSDIPYDYLTLYANAEEVHSDRVHACVAALAYGRMARFYHPTPRGSLFETVGAHGIRDGLIQLDMHILAQKKIQQVEFVKHLVRNL